MKNYKNITRQEFMDFFRDDDKLNELSPDDRAEIFSTIMLDSSDFSKELIEDIFSDYGVNFKVIDLDKINQLNISSIIVNASQTTNYIYKIKIIIKAHQP